MNNFEDKSAKQLHKAVTKEKQCECPCHGLKLNVSDNFKNSCSHCQSPKIDVLQTIIKGIWISGFMNHSKGQQEGFEQIKFILLSLIKQNAGQLRQWLNEDRITDPKKMVTTEQILHWLDIDTGDVEKQ